MLQVMKSSIKVIRKRKNKHKIYNILKSYIIMFNNKKGETVINSVVLWIFSCFFYFIIGYDIVKGIVQAVFLDGGQTGLMYFFGAIVPILPILGLMFWGYTILNPEPIQTQF